MPQDTTIYWDGYGKIPAEIDSLPFDQRQQVLSVIHKKRDEASYSDPTGTYLFLIAFIIIFSIAAIYSNNKTKRALKDGTGSGSDDAPPGLPRNPPVLIYTGNKLKFNDELIIAVLTKRFPFYNLLNEAGKIKFITRLKKFISLKTFIIHDTSGFKEMPILIGATAIQISFGLDKYLLPNFTTFNIYPREFVGTYPFIRFLVGNVSGNTINLSWKHLLDGLQSPADGQNVAVHEMAHALYYQTFIVEKNVDKDFRDTFTGFNEQGNKVYKTAKENSTGLYSDYAVKDFQEFWAESVELFFEKPLQLKTIYPDLYFVMSNLLNQDPAGSASLHFT